jgi:uncharacterized membrane protein YdjX (TVP38/TMEM64 family)
MKPVKVVRIAAALLFPLIIAGMIILVLVFKEELWDLFANTENLQEYIGTWGPTGPLIFVGVQVIQVIVFIIPGEVAQIAGGYLFGVWLGLLYSLIGISIGSSFNFFLARLLGINSMKTLFGEAKIAKFDDIMDARRTRIAFFLFFVIPGIPKDILCYVGGLSKMSFPSFFLISMAGRLPGVLGSTIIGDAAAARKWLLAGSILAVATVLFFIGLKYRERIHSFIETISTTGKRREENKSRNSE